MNAYADVDLDLTMANIRLNWAIFINYKIFKNTHTHTPTHTHNTHTHTKTDSDEYSLVPFKKHNYSNNVLMAKKKKQNPLHSHKKNIHYLATANQT